MIVIADTGPINYLVLIDAVEIPQPLYTRVIVPQAVVEELSQQGTPAPVLAWIRQPPSLARSAARSALRSHARFPRSARGPR